MSKLSRFSYGSQRRVSRAALGLFFLLWLGSGCRPDRELPAVPDPVFPNGFGKLDTLVRGLNKPWGLSRVGEALFFTEREGGFFCWQGDSLQEIPLTLPRFQAEGQGGLLDLHYHRGYFYFTHTGSRPGGSATFLARAAWDSTARRLGPYELLYEGADAAGSALHFGSRIAIDRQDFLYFSIGDRGQQAQAQNTGTNFGSILRLHLDGRIPADNPFAQSADTLPEIWSYGHRNPQGLAFAPSTGELWSHEHGPQGGDELNRIRRGANYGWPLATHGRNYDGSPVSPDTSLPGMIDPVRHWTPSIAPSGMAIGPADAEGTLEIFVGALVGQKLLRLLLREGEFLQSETLLDQYARFRAVERSANGDLYILTENPGMLLHWPREY